MPARRSLTAPISPWLLLLALGCGGNDPDEPAPQSLTEEDPYLPVPLAEGLAPTPPMGWNSWNYHACNINVRIVEETADALVDSGMRDAGYEYLNIDDCWARIERDENDRLEATPNFPGGISAVADYVHERGLKLGIYGDRGTATCAGRAGSEGYEELDAQSFAEWGVDYLKYDNCHATLDAETQYRTMREALDASGRPIVFSICAWQFYEWGVGMGHLWRTTGDITNTWSSVMSLVNTNRSLAAYAGPNGWNDPDMLQVGNDGLTEVENRAHFSLWAIMAAPLIAGNDVTQMDEATRRILTNEEVIAINQDALGFQGVPVTSDGTLEVWAKPLNESGARAVVLLNRGDSTEDITVRFEDIGLRPGAAALRDLWEHADLGVFEDEFTASVPSHGEVTLKIQGNEPEPPSGDVFLSDLPWIYAANAVGRPELDTNNGGAATGDGTAISLGGTTYDKGLGVAPGSLIVYRLGQTCRRFQAEIGVGDEMQGSGSVVFQVFADGQELFDSGVMTGSDPAQSVDVDVSGKHRLRLLVTNADDGADGDRGSWANARLQCD